MDIKISKKTIPFLIVLIVFHYVLNATDGIGKYIFIISISTLILLIYSKKKVSPKLYIYNAILIL